MLKEFKKENVGKKNVERKKKMHDEKKKILEL